MDIEVREATIKRFQHVACIWIQRLTFVLFCFHWSNTAFLFEQQLATMLGGHRFALTLMNGMEGRAVCVE